LHNHQAIGNGGAIFENCETRRVATQTAGETADHLMAIIIKAWNFYRQDKKVKALHYSAERESFPELA
jgi:hypothetical protein